MGDLTGRNRDLLFVCVENAGRSQMAEAFALALGLCSTSAGTQPASEINPQVVRAMGERGIDISARRPKSLTPEAIENASVIVTMGCSVEELCPAPMLAAMRTKVIDWHLEDPKGKELQRVRAIRDEIEEKVRGLAYDLSGR